MSKWIWGHRFLVSRRLLQVGLIILFAGGNWFGWKFLMGNYSAAYVLESFYLADPHAVLQISFAGFLVGMDLFIGALIIFLFYALIAGRAFCSWVCPINILADTVKQLRIKLHMTRTGPHPLPGKKARYYVLGMGLVLSILTGVAAFEFINPVTMLHRGIIFGFGLGWTIVAMVVLFDFAVVEHGWCGHLCPIGAFYAIPASLSLLKVKHIHENCTLCNKCKIVCPESQVLKIIGVNSGLITSGECTNCGRCIEVCDDKALKFTINNYKIRRMS
ncbi:MAG: quinol dehydrogenase ferredoxin subunit NapH [Bacteroidota bacterium]|nr:quinol dehydrogenase ferredoxin subunit NapH [Bacteroidota bacterium]